MLAAMITLATVAHNGQFDKGGKPYILHPLTVMHWVKSDEEEVLCIAVGHDLIEDTKTTFDELRQIGMSERVIEGIRALTKMPGETKEQYRAKVIANKDAVLVKMADLRHNTDLLRLKGVSEKDLARNKEYAEFFHLLKALPK